MVWAVYQEINKNGLYASFHTHNSIYIYFLFFDQKWFIQRIYKQFNSDRGIFSRFLFPHLLISRLKSKECHIIG
jgi:hypothetical protein